MARKQPASTEKQPDKAVPTANKEEAAIQTAKIAAEKTEAAMEPAKLEAEKPTADKTKAAVQEAKFEAEKEAASKAEAAAETVKPAAEQNIEKAAVSAAEKDSAVAESDADKPAANSEEEPAAPARKTRKTETAAASAKSAAKKAGKRTVKKAAKPAAKKTRAAAKKSAPTPVEEVPAPMQEPPRPEEESTMEQYFDTPRRSIAFIGSECHPFVKTGGLGDVMYALPRALVKQNCDVRVILPRYACIPQQYQDKMVYRGEFYMDLGLTGRNYYVGIMEYVWDGVVYDFIDNQEFFSSGSPYVNLVDDIPKYCYFSKAALAALNYMNWIPDIIHCHDWQAALVPVYLRTMFQNTPVGHAKTILTIHNLRFQGIYNIPTIKYWTGLPDEAFGMGALKQGYEDANMLKGGLAYADRITTVSGTYAWEIQTPEYGEKLENHLRYHSYKLRGIVNGIDYEMWNPATDPALAVNYDITNVWTTSGRISSRCSRNLAWCRIRASSSSA